MPAGRMRSGRTFARARCGGLGDLATARWPSGAARARVTPICRGDAGPGVATVRRGRAEFHHRPAVQRTVADASHFLLDDAPESVQQAIDDVMAAVDAGPGAWPGDH